MSLWNVSLSRLSAAVAGLAVALGLGLGAAAGDRADRVLADYEKTGETVSCLGLSQVRDSDPLDDYAILFEASGKMYLNELSGRCNRLGRERRFSYRTPQNRICKGDIITVIDSIGVTLGSCSLGEFQALSKIEKQKEALVN